MTKMLNIAKWIKTESVSKESKYIMIKVLAKEVITHTSACHYLDTMYYNSKIFMKQCTSMFASYLIQNI